MSDTSSVGDHSGVLMVVSLADESLSRAASEIVPSTTVSSTPVDDSAIFSSGVVGLTSMPESESTSVSSGQSTSVGPSPLSLSVDIIETNPVVSSLVRAVVDVSLLSHAGNVGKRSSPSEALSLSLVHGGGVSTEVVSLVSNVVGSSSSGSVNSSEVSNTSSVSKGSHSANVRHASSVSGSHSADVGHTSAVGHDSSVMSSTSTGDVIVTPAVLSSSTEGISEDTVVAALPASGVSVGVPTVDSITDSTVAVAASSTASGVFSATVSPVGTLDGGLGEFGSGRGHSGNDEGKNDGNLSHA